MRLHIAFGVRYRSHLRPYARAYAYRGLRAFASLSMARSVRWKDKGAKIVLSLRALTQTVGRWCQRRPESVVIWPE